MRAREGERGKLQMRRRMHVHIGAKKSVACRSLLKLCADEECSAIAVPRLLRYEQAWESSVTLCTLWLVVRGGGRCTLATGCDLTRLLLTFCNYSAKLAHDRDKTVGMSLFERSDGVQRLVHFLPVIGTSVLQLSSHSDQADFPGVLTIIISTWLAFVFAVSVNEVLLHRKDVPYFVFQ